MTKQTQIHTVISVDCRPTVCPVCWFLPTTFFWRLPFCVDNILYILWLLYMVADTVSNPEILLRFQLSWLSLDIWFRIIHTFSPCKRVVTATEEKKRLSSTFSLWRLMTYTKKMHNPRPALPCHAYYLLPSHVPLPGLLGSALICFFSAYSLYQVSH